MSIFKRSKAYYMGRDAFNDGLRITRNPFRTWNLIDKWNTGWYDAQAKYERELDARTLERYDK